MTTAHFENATFVAVDVPATAPPEPRPRITRTKVRAFLLVAVRCVLFAGVLVFCAYAAWYDLERAKPILVIVGLWIAWRSGGRIARSKRVAALTPFARKIADAAKRVATRRWCPTRAGFAVLGATCATLTVVAATIALALRDGGPAKIVPLIGYVVFLAVLYVGSRDRAAIRWRPVIGGIVLQFAFALLALRWTIGVDAVGAIGNVVTGFLSFADAGSEFVFGADFRRHFFAFAVLPTIVFFSSVVSILYYVGIVDAAVGKLAGLMRFTLGTTAPESICAAANVFVGQTEAPILARPFLASMTRSELHAVMVGGFATVSGGAMAAYAQLGVPIERLICASLMNAPCALAAAKLFYPEDEPVLDDEASTRLPTRPEEGDAPTRDGEEGREGEEEETRPTNIVEAAASGASAAVTLVANVAANLVAFVALLTGANALLSWLGAAVGVDGLSFELVCSYLFRPVAFAMGVAWNESGRVAELLGAKLFLNEFVAYSRLVRWIENRNDCLTDAATITRRSEVIASYVLCGFANFSSIGIQLGGIGAIAPTRRRDLARVVIRALAAGTIVSLLTACVANALTRETITPTMAMCVSVNATAVNGTFVENAISGTRNISIRNIIPSF